MRGHRNHDLLSSTSPLFSLGKVEEEEEDSLAMEPQYTNVGVACNGLGPAGCVYHSTEIYGGGTYASYDLGNMPRGREGQGAVQSNRLDVEKVGRFTADWLDGGVEEEYGD